MDVPARGWAGRSDPDSEGSAHASRVAEAQSAGEDRAHSKRRETKMQVSSPPPMGVAGQRAYFNGTINYTLLKNEKSGTNVKPVRYQDERNKLGLS